MSTYIKGLSSYAYRSHRNHSVESAEKSGTIESALKNWVERSEASPDAKKEQEEVRKQYIKHGSLGKVRRVETFRTHVDAVFSFLQENNVTEEEFYKILKLNR